MQLKTCIFSLFFLFIFISFSPILSSSSSQDDVCKITPFPSFCQSLLPKRAFTNTIYDDCRTLMQVSLSSTKFFLSLVDSQLVLNHGSVVTDKTTIQALQDCQFLSNLNLEYLSETLETMSSTNTLDSSKVEDLHTMLSATIANQQTCLDGLETTFSSPLVRNILLDPLTRVTKIYRVALALFKHGWVDNEGKWGRWFSHRNFVLPKVDVSNSVVVDPKGGGNFTTINAAVAAAPDSTSSHGIKSYFVIHVVAGVYAEYVSIPKTKQNLMMIGDGIGRTIITGNRSVIGDRVTTFNTATFAVIAKGFVAVNITFRNTAGPSLHQAVALRSGADESTFFSCSFEGYQDTLYVHSHRQFYKNCIIYGTIDFIFGDAATVLQDCTIFVRLPNQEQTNVITASSRKDVNENTGIVIQDCTIKAAPEFTDPRIRTYLGRPWDEFARTIYMQSFLDKLIDPAGWKDWNGTFALSTLYYAEFNNTGPGSDVRNRVKWPGYKGIISAADAGIFTVSKLLSGDEWLPPTQVPYKGGL